MSHSSNSFSTTGEQVRIVRLSDKQREIDRLPPVTTRRWVTSRKAQVVTAVRTGLLSLSEACERYHLSTEEFRSWARLFDEHGVRGLRATRIQEYRHQGDGEGSMA
jgi:transposase-like protein